MKKKRTLISPFTFHLSLFTFLLFASCSDEVQTDKFSSQNGDIVATRTVKGSDTTWTFNDASGAPLIPDCDSIKVTASYPSSQPMEAVFHHKGQQTMIKFYDEMEKFSEGDIKNGKPDGLWIAYDKNTGKKQSETYFTDGVENGTYKVYNENGTPRVVGQYLNGKKTGEWTFYDIHGVLEGTSTY